MEKYWMNWDTYYKNEHCKICKVLNDSTASKFVTRKWTKVHDLSCSQYSVNKNIRFKMPMLKSDFYDCNDGCLCEKEIIDDEQG